jgi:hypothetical protein
LVVAELTKAELDHPPRKHLVAIQFLGLLLPLVVAVVVIPILLSLAGLAVAHQ